MAQTPVIELRHIQKHFGALHVLKDINLTVNKGEVVVIIGPSGSGKSTLCRTINRLETIDSGEILIDGAALPQEGRQLAQLRAQVGMVFQSFNLFAHKTILDNVTIGPIDVLPPQKTGAGRGSRPAAPGWCGESGRQAALPTVRRAAAARGHRPGAGHASQSHSL